MLMCDVNNEKKQTWSDESFDFVKSILKASEFNYDGYCVLFCVNNDQVRYENELWMSNIKAYKLLVNKNETLKETIKTLMLLPLPIFLLFSSTARPWCGLRWSCVGVRKMSDLSFPSFKIANHHERRGRHDQTGTRSGVEKNKNSRKVKS